MAPPTTRGCRAPSAAASGCSESMSTPEKFSAALRAQCRPIRHQTPPLANISGTAQTSTPIENVIALPRSAPAAPRPARCTSTSASSGSVNHMACDRMPMASADRLTRRPRSCFPTSASASGVRDGFKRRRTKADASAACAASVEASPGTSLSGRQRGEPEQRSCHDDQCRERGAALAIRGPRRRSSV